MTPERKAQSDTLRQEDILKYSAVYIERLVSKIERRTPHSASILRGQIQSGFGDFTLAESNFIIERTQTNEKSFVLVSLTRFPLDTADGVISEGIRFKIANPKLTADEGFIEYHIAKKDNQTLVSVNKKETLKLIRSFIANIQQHEPPLSG